MNNKGDGGLTAIVIIVVIIVFLAWLVNISQRECHSNKDCTDEQYCGSDFACHRIPIIERETSPTVIQRNYLGPAWIIGIAMVITAILFNLDKIFPRRYKEKKEDTAAYYKKQSSK
jgi:hypothetical protein